jgi:hypothetical protein
VRCCGGCSRARQQIAKRVVEQLELSGVEIDEQQRILRKRDAPAAGRLLRCLLVEPFQLSPPVLELLHGRADLAEPGSDL